MINQSINQSIDPNKICIAHPTVIRSPELQRLTLKTLGLNSRPKSTIYIEPRKLYDKIKQKSVDNAE